MRFRFAFGLVVTFIAVLAVAAAVPQAEQTTRELFPHTTDLGRAAVEYEDDDLHVVAAYYHSQQNHDSKWLLFEVAISADRNIRIDRDDIYLLTPDDRRVPLATQSAWSRDHRLVRPMLLQARSTRHAIGSYFKESNSRNFRFFVPPFGGTSYPFFNANQWRTSRGDLFFASPTGAWATGTYSLVFESSEEEARAVLPIDLE